MQTNLKAFFDVFWFVLSLLLWVHPGPQQPNLSAKLHQEQGLQSFLSPDEVLSRLRRQPQSRG